MKKFNTVFYMILICSGLALGQGPGNPFFPETANGASSIPHNYHFLRWQNPSGATHNEVYLSYDSILVAEMDTSVRIFNGHPSTVIDSVVIQNLYKTTRYFWRIVEYGSDGFTPGPLWYFVTDGGGWAEFFKYDDFSYGTNMWTITSNPGSCQWDIDNANNYLLPPPAFGKILSANNSNCAGMINTSAEFQQINNLTYFGYGWIEFNSDWVIDHANDSAIVQISYDQGITWNTIWSKAGVSARNEHVIIYDAFVNENQLYNNCRIRFKTFQNGGNSWWAIDNVSFYFASGVLTPPYTTNLHTNLFQENNQVKVALTWSQVVGLPGASVVRKSGIPTDTSSYQVIGTITNGALTFIDSTVMDSSIYTYRVGGDRYTNESTAYVYSVIPVELNSFTASMNGSNIYLKWITASETNNYGFSIERKSSSYDWQPVGFVEGKGTVTETNQYSFIDKKLSPGRYFYRLKQIDFDGSFEYSNEIEVEVGIPELFTLHQNYPNPFNPSTKISWQSPVGSHQTLKVYDVLGREVAVLVDEYKPAGRYEVEFDASQLSSGIYYYQLRAGDYIATKKMMVVR